MKQRIIVIDPGHGGVDSGTVGRYKKTLEKNVTLSYALELKKLLEKDTKYKVFLTRKSDVYIPLLNRRNIAKKLKADIFISLHADSSSNKDSKGASIYTLSDRAYDRASKILSERENKVDIISSINLKNEKKDIANFLIDLVRRDTKNNSATFANIIAKELGKNIELKREPHKFAGFLVLKGVEVPAILVELGYLSNKKEELLLANSDAYRKKVTKAMVAGINKYFS